MENKLDTEKYLRRVIIVSWVGLFICLVIKLFGFNIFEIACKNENFIAVCNYVDNNLWADYLISSLYCFISLYFFILAILQQIKYTPCQLIVVIVTVLAGTALKLWNMSLGWIFDLWQNIIIPIIFLGKNFKQYWKVLLANVLLIVFQLISMFIRNTSTNEIYNSSILGTIFAIDVILMLILYFSYANIIKKGEQTMSKWFAWFQKDNVAELKKDLAKLEKKKTGLCNEIAEVDEQINATNKKIKVLESKEEN